MATTSKSAASKPAATKPSTVKSSAVKSASTKSAAPSPEAANKPVASKPVATKAVPKTPAKKPSPIAKPAASKPVASKPEAAKSKTAEPVMQATKATAPSESAISGLLLEAGSAPLENMQEMVRQFAETGLGQSQSVFNSFRDAADSATVSFEESSAATRAALSKMNEVFTATVLAGSTAMTDTMKALGEAETASDFVTIWNQQSQKQFEVMVKNSQELTAAFRSCAEEAARPFVSAYSHSFQG
jgi:hypothetical protein